MESPPKALFLALGVLYCSAPEPSPTSRFCLLNNILSSLTSAGMFNDPAFQVGVTVDKRGKKASTEGDMQ